MGQRTAIVLKIVQNIPQSVGLTTKEEVRVFYHRWGIGRVLPSQLLSLVLGTLSVQDYITSFGKYFLPTGCLDITDDFNKEDFSDIGFHNPAGIGKLIKGADNNNGGLYVEITESAEHNITIEYNYMLGGSENDGYKKFCTFEEWRNKNYGEKYIDKNFLRIYHKTLRYFGAKEREIAMGYKSEKEKASACLKELEEYDTKTVINLLNEYLSDEALAEVYDKLMEDK